MWWDIWIALFSKILNYGAYLRYRGHVGPQGATMSRSSFFTVCLNPRRRLSPAPLAMAETEQQSGKALLKTTALIALPSSLWLLRCCVKKEYFKRVHWSTTWVIYLVNFVCLISLANAFCRSYPAKPYVFCNVTILHERLYIFKLTRSQV